MSNLKDVVALNVNGEGISLHDILYSMKLRNATGVLQDSAAEAVIARAVSSAGISISDDELQEAADAFRAENGLHRIADTEAWLQARSMTLEDMEASLERGLATEKLRDQLASDGATQKYFAENKLRFDAVDISQIVVSDEGLAEELYSQITEEDEDFYQLASQHSIDASGQARGYLGKVARKSLSPQVESVVYGADMGDIVGPVKTDQGYHVIKIEAFRSGALDDETQGQIRQLLFDQWLQEKLAEANVTMPIFDMV